jgi:hypothetical protein
MIFPQEHNSNSFVFSITTVQQPQILGITSRTRITVSKNYVVELICKVYAQPFVRILWKHKSIRIPFHSSLSYSNGVAVSTITLNFTAIESMDVKCSTPDQIRQVTNCRSEVTCEAFYSTFKTEGLARRTVVFHFNISKSTLPL